MTTKAKRKTKAKATKRRKPASVLAWAAYDSDGFYWSSIDDTEEHAAKWVDVGMGDRVERIRITVVPRGAKR